MTETPDAASAAPTSFFQSVLGWLHSGYPDGVPRTDYYPLLALLKRALSEDEGSSKLSGQCLVRVSACR